MADDVNGGAAPAPAAPAAAPTAVTPPASAPAAAAAAPPAAPATPGTLLTPPAADPNAPPAAAPTPIEYTDFKLPEGVTADAEALTSFKDAAKGLGLKQEQAQQLVDLYAGRQLAAAQAQQAAAQQLIESWASQAKADPEFGGAKFDASVANAARALDRFATPELRTLLTQTGLGNHPEMVRLCARIGATLGESAFVPGNGPAKPPANSAAALYDKSPQLR